MRVDTFALGPYGREVYRLFLALALAGNACAQSAAPVPPPPERATVFVAQDPSAINSYVEAPTVTKRMVDRLVVAATGKPDVAAAWKSLVTPKDVVGIKVSTVGGRYFSSHRGVVEAVASGLEQAGIPRARQIIFDRDSAQLRTAGFVTKAGGSQVRGVDPPRGLDPKAVFFAPAFGRLIAGDLSFQVKKGLKRPLTQDDQLSPESHLPYLLTREITKIVNVAVLSDEAGCGIASALYNVTVPNVDNGRRFSQRIGNSSICDLYLDERIGPRTVLHIVDGLTAQYAGGPRFNPNYAFAHQTIYASKDPVALDTLLVSKLETWRQEAKLPPIAALTEWLSVGEELGIGFHDRSKIDVQNVK